MKTKMFRFFLICMVIAGLSSCSYIQKIQGRKIADLETMVSSLEDEYVPIKFKLNKTKGDEISIKVLFQDLEGNTIKEETVSILGSEIHFDFQVIQLTPEKKNTKKVEKSTLAQYMFYPYKIYSEKVEPENGIDLCTFYDKKGFPAIYEGFVNFLPEDRQKYEKGYTEKITQTFEYILNGELEKLTNQYGSAVHDMQGISEFKKGYVYSVVCHPHTGGIEIRSE